MPCADFLAAALASAASCSAREHRSVTVLHRIKCKYTSGQMVHLPELASSKPQHDSRCSLLYLFCPPPAGLSLYRENRSSCTEGTVLHALHTSYSTSCTAQNGTLRHAQRTVVHAQKVQYFMHCTEGAVLQKVQYLMHSAVRTQSGNCLDIFETV